MGGVPSCLNGSGFYWSSRRAPWRKAGKVSVTAAQKPAAESNLVNGICCPSHRYAYGRESPHGIYQLRENYGADFWMPYVNASVLKRHNAISNPFRIFAQLRDAE